MMKSTSKFARTCAIFLVTMLSLNPAIVLPTTTMASSNLTMSTFIGVGAGKYFAHPIGITYSPDGSIYVADRDTYSIKKIVGDRISIITKVDQTSLGFHVGNELCSIFTRNANEIYFSTCSNSVIYKINSSGTILKTIQVSAPGWQKSWSWAHGITVDSKGNIFLTDQTNNVILKVSEASGDGEIFAGAYGQRGNLNGLRTNARFSSPSGITIDSKDNIYIADEGNNAIRQILPNGYVTTKWTSSQCGGVTGVATDSGDRLFAIPQRFCGSIIREIGSPKNIYDDSAETRADNIPLNIVGKPLFAGSAAFSIDRWGNSPSNQFALGDFANHNVKVISKEGQLIRTLGTPNTWGTTIRNNSNTAAFNHPTSIHALSDNSFILQDLSTLRHISSSGEILNTLPLTQSCWYSPFAVFSADGIFFCKNGNSVIAHFPDGTISTIGSGARGYRDGTNLTSQFSDPNGAAFYNGDLYIADQGNKRIRKITRISNSREFQVSTFAGNGNNWNGTIVQPKSSASFTYPTDLTFDSKGNLYVLDGGVDSLFKITPGNNGTITRVANGMKNWPTAITSDSSDRIYIVTERGFLYKYDQNELTYLGGNGAGHQDGPLTSALLYGPVGLTIDQNGNLYIVESQNQAVRKIALGENVRGLGILDARNFSYVMRGATRSSDTYIRGLNPTGGTAPIQQSNIVPIAPFDAEIKVKNRKISIRVSMATSVDGAYLVASTIGISESKPLKGKVTGAKAVFAFQYAQKHVGKNVRISIYGTNGDLRSPALTFPLQLGQAKKPIKQPPASNTAPTGITCKKGNTLRVFIATKCPTGFIPG